MVYRLWRRLRPYDLDRPIPEEAVNPEDPARVAEFLRHLLRAVVCDDFAAVHFFFHEEDRCVRVCRWRADTSQPGTWFEWVPMTADSGMRLLGELRRAAWRRCKKGSRVSGALRYRWKGEVKTMMLESAHDWDVRLYLDERRPQRLPYSLVFVETMAEKRSLER
jgi:hypothetical protein